MFWKHVAHFCAVVGLIATLWASLLQARRAIDKAAKVKNISGKAVDISMWSGLTWRHNLKTDVDEFDIEHFRRVAGLWALLLAAGIVALGAEALNWLTDAHILE